MPKLLPEEFQVLARYIRELTGIALDESKQYLVENRFAGLLQEYRCTTYSELYYKARSDATQALICRFIDTITTGETLFFRDAAPFDLLQHKILPDLIDRRSRRPGRTGPIPLKIWSAACSSGQEVYSIAIVLKELLVDLGRYDIRLLGTDISDAAVARASLGKYNAFEIRRGLSEDRLRRHFSCEGDAWRIRDEIRAMATFRRVNLLGACADLGRFDVVFCRNVAIYFSEEDKKRLFEKLCTLLEPDGCLIIGATEALTGVCPRLVPRRYLRSVYYELTP